SPGRGRSTCRDLGFEPCEGIAEAVAVAEAERQVERPRPGEVESVRILEDVGVAVARGQEEAYRIAFADGYPRDLGRPLVASMRLLHRRAVPQELLDRVRSDARLHDEQGPLVSM